MIRDLYINIRPFMIYIDVLRDFRSHDSKLDFDRGAMALRGGVETLFVFFVLALCSSGVVGEHNDLSVDIRPCEGPFSCFLRNITVDVPGPIIETSHTFKITVSDINVTGFSIGVIESALVERNTTNTSRVSETWGLDVVLNDVGGAVYLDFAYREVIPPHKPNDQGSVAATFYGRFFSFFVFLFDGLGVEKEF
jgi:hypothetical protein